MKVQQVLFMILLIAGKSKSQVHEGQGDELMIGLILLIW